MNNARILIITGPGKGKTTAATGTLLRALGCGKKALLTRFTKASHSSELEILRTLPNLTILSGDYGMTPKPDHPDYPKHVAAARELFNKTVVAAAEYDTIVMDEICGVVARGMVNEGEVIEFLTTLRPDQAAILTGRGATPALIASADTVSEILTIKHAYQRGINAQKGVEY